MKKLFVLLFLGALALSLGTHSAIAQSAGGTVVGKVVRWDGSPVAGATIAVLQGRLETDKELSHTTTGADGSYSIAVPDGQTIWMHVRTFGTWWGYSYTPMNLRPSEVISQVYFAL